MSSGRGVPVAVADHSPVAGGVDCPDLHVVLGAVREAPDDIVQGAASPGVVSHRPVGVHRLVCAGLDVANVVGRYPSTAVVGGAVQATARVLSPRLTVEIVGASDLATIGSSAAACDQAPCPAVLWARSWNSYFTPPRAPLWCAPVGGSPDTYLHSPLVIALICRIVPDVAQVVGGDCGGAGVGWGVPFNSQGASARRHRTDVGRSGNEAVPVNGDPPRTDIASVAILLVC